MISLTPAAQAHFIKLLEPQQKVTLGTKRSGCSGLSYELAIVEEVDVNLYEAISTEPPVFVEKKSEPYLKGLVIDLLVEGLQSRIVYKNPNEKGACGCGESFSV